MNQLFINTYYRSNKPEAEHFTDWVTSKVLPSIRKTGQYSIDSKELRDYKEWERVRIICKQNRRDFTKEIDIFIEYAKEQGSTAPKWYYTNFTKLVNSNLFGCPSARKVKKNLRDYLNDIQLSTITTMEYMLSKLIVDEISQGTNYKDIYQLAKVQANKFGLLIGKERPAYLNGNEIKKITNKKYSEQLLLLEQ